MRIKPQWEFALGRVFLTSQRLPETLLPSTSTFLRVLAASAAPAALDTLNVCPGPEISSRLVSSRLETSLP
jgi:hypothetical protein